MPSFTADKTDRLDKFLAGKLPASRSRIQAAIKQGLITINGRPKTETDYKVSVGDQVSLPEFEQEELRPLSLDLKIAFENKDFAIIDKPAGLVVHPGAGHKQDTLANALLTRFPGIEKVGDPKRPGIVHRLDEDTSGLLVVAKNQEAFDYLKKLFLEKQIEKQYLALVHGIPPALHGIIDLPVGKTSTHKKMKAGTGKPSITEYAVLAQSVAIDQYALLRLKLHTGRTHQIRVHLSHIGLPIVGDQLYGGHFKQGDVTLLPRQFLHAARLKFRMPDGTWLDVESELPDDLKSILNNLGIKYASSV